STFDFVLRWEIDNLNAVVAARHAEPKVFVERGFEWIAGVRPKENDEEWAEFILTCKNKSDEWRCEVDVDFVTVRSEGDDHDKRRVTFSNDDNVHDLDFWAWEDLNDPNEGFVNNDMMVVEYRIRIISSEGNEAFESTPIDLSKFYSPNDTSNVTLVIGDNKLRVSKDYLAMHSPVFSAMFFGEYCEKDKEEIEIKEVVYEDFIQLLLIISPTRAKISDSTAHRVLALGDRFQIESIRVEAETH
ncbi:hypothetical protein PENTCL1PPCAC_24379, partial [Pristionchus entomophagus]